MPLPVWLGCRLGRHDVKHALRSADSDGVRTLVLYALRRLFGRPTWNRPTSQAFEPRPPSTPRSEYPFHGGSEEERDAALREWRDRQ